MSGILIYDLEAGRVEPTFGQVVVDVDKFVDHFGCRRDEVADILNDEDRMDAWEFVREHGTKMEW